MGSRLFLDFVGLPFLLGMVSFLQRLDGPGISADVSTTVSGKGGFLDEDLGMLSFLRRLGGPGRSADVSTTVSGKGRFLDEDSSTLLKAEEGIIFFCLDFGLEEKISSISDMVARRMHCVTSDVTGEDGFVLRLSTII